MFLSYWKFRIVGDAEQVGAAVHIMALILYIFGSNAVIPVSLSVILLLRVCLCVCILIYVRSLRDTCSSHVLSSAAVDVVFCVCWKVNNGGS